MKNNQIRFQAEAGRSFFHAKILLVSLLFLSCSLLNFNSPLCAFEQKHVLILHSYHQGMLWPESISRGLESEIPYDPSRIIHVEYMDTKRHPSEEHQEALREFYRKKYAKLKISVIISSDDNAFHFALKHRKELFSNAPLVFCGVNHFRPEDYREYSNFTGIVEKNDHLKTINLALSLHPDARRLFVINDLTTTGKANRSAMENSFSLLKKSLDVRFCGNVSLDELKEQIKVLPDDYLILLLSFNQDSTGRVFGYREIGAHVKEVAKRPVYCVWDFFFDGCATGGCITRGFDQGIAAGQMMRRILSGENASDIPVVSKYLTKYMFDYNKLKEFGVPESRLPDESIILNRPYSFYRENTALFWQITLVGFTILALLVGLGLSLLKLMKSQQELEEGRQSLKITLDSIAEAVISTDGSGKIIRMNPIAEKLSGWFLNEARGKSLEEVFRIKDHAGEFCQNLTELVLKSSGQVNLNRFGFFVHKLEKEFPVSVSVSTIRDEFGDVFGIVAVFRDMTDESILQERLRHSQKMDAIGQLAGGVAHDFNNALSGIIGAVQLLQRDMDSAYGNKILKLIQKSADRAADLTAKLLAFSRKSKIETEAQDFHTIVQTANDILSRTIDRRIHLETRLLSEFHIINGNFSELESVLLNIGINASHAMPDGGTLSMETRNITLNEEYCLASNFALTPGVFLLLEVSDTGTGISPENLPKIFEPFFTTKEPGKGTGLGLSAAYGTIVQHKGAINVYSELGRGTVFRIYLPVFEGKAKIEEDSYEIVPGTGTILIVDDEPAIRFTNRLLLESAGYKVLLAENGLEGLEIYQQKKDEIALVILDMIMPEMNGSDCFARLIEFNPEAKVILCSGFPQDADVASMKKAGLVSFLYKPCRGDELSRAVAEALNHSAEKPSN